MRSEDYLITTSVGNVSRKIVWHSDKAAFIDLPGGWEIEKVNGQIRIRDLAEEDIDRQLESALLIDTPYEGSSENFKLPPSKAWQKRALNIELHRLKPMQAVYMVKPQSHMLPVSGRQQLCAFYGQRYFLIRYRPVGASYKIMLGKVEIFNYGKSPSGTVHVWSAQDELKVKLDGKKIPVRVGQMLEMPEQEFFAATFVLGVHWWRFRMVPTPDALPPLETDESEEDLQEKKRFKTSAIGFLSFFLLASIAIYIFTLLHPPPPKIVKADVFIKQPKLIPPLEAPKPPPPPPEPPQPEKIVKQPEPHKKPKPKPEAPKKVVHKKQPPHKPKHIAESKAAKPKPVNAKKAEPAPKPVVTKKQPTPKPSANPGPTAAQIKAAEQAAQQAQLVKSLGFLSSSSKRPSVDASNYEKKGKFSNNPMVGGVASKSNVLDKMANEAPGDGTIKTRSARNFSAEVKFGKGKGLNDVQGKVSLGELYSKDGTPGESIGGGKGIELSGPGEMAESLIEKALSKYLSRFQYCYEKALLSDASLGGNLVVQWDITTAGKTASPRVLQSQLNNKDLHACVLKVLKEVPFPKPKGGLVTVKKTFSFTSSTL